jgi:hypothetical protein
MVTWPNFLCYVIIYIKDEHSRQKLIRNLRKFVDMNRCINLYIGKFYCVRNMYGVNVCLYEHVFDDVFNQFMSMCLMIIS